jgi:hypothetical protein
MRKLFALLAILPLLMGFADSGGTGEGGEVNGIPAAGGGGGCTNKLNFSVACNSQYIPVVLK